jgi:hypothetical protein
MAYSTYSINEYNLPSVAQSANSSQLDTIIFCDYHQGSTPSATVPSQGGVIYSTLLNGGAITNNTQAHIEAFGVTACSGVISLSTGTTSNSTGYSVQHTSPLIVPGFSTPSSGKISKYEVEALLRTDSTIHGNSPTTLRGFYRFGWQSSITNTVSTDGVYFEYLCDGTTTDTTWNIVFRKDGTQSRADTTVAVTASKTYRLYLSVEVDSGGTATTTYNVRNVTDSTGASGTASPSSSSHYPTGSADYMGLVLTNSKITTTSTTARLIFVDYIGCRIRRELSRQILLYS